MATALVFWGLVVWRVTAMLSKERGPLDAFVRLRAMLAMRQKRMGGLFDMIDCFKCLSIWVAVIPAIVLSYSVGSFIAYDLALSAIAIIFHLLIKKLDSDIIITRTSNASKQPE